MSKVRCGFQTVRGPCDRTPLKGGARCAHHVNADGSVSPHLPMEIDVDEFDLTATEGVVKFQAAMVKEVHANRFSAEKADVLNTLLKTLLQSLKQLRDESPAGQAAKLEAAAQVAKIIASMAPNQARELLVKHEFISVPQITQDVDAIDVKPIPVRKIPLSHETALARYMPKEDIPAFLAAREQEALTRATIEKRLKEPLKQSGAEQKKGRIPRP